jgi:hypothetical protein
MVRKLVCESLYEYRLLNESKESISFVDPELDYSELFRLYNVLNKELPADIDKSLFDSDKYYAQVIPKGMNNILQKKYSSGNGDSVKSEVDAKWHPFIDFLLKKFRGGTKKTVGLDFLKDVYFGEDYKSNEQSFHNFIIDPDYRKKAKSLDNYFDSFNWFDKHKENIPLPVIAKIGSRYFLVGGNRRLSWLISKGVKEIPVWLI